MRRNLWLKLSIVLNLVLIVGLVYVVNKADLVENKSTKILNKSTVYPKYEQKVSLFNSLVTREKVDVVFIGDSLTERSLWNEIFPDKIVVNRGIERDTTAGVLKRLDDIKRLHPDKVFLMIGINDLNFGVKVDKVFERYSSIVSTIQKNSPDTQLYLQSILPVDDARNNTNNRSIDLLNKKIKSLATTDKITYIDINSKLKGKRKGLDPKYSNDGLHIMGNAYIIWANTIRQYIEE